MLKVWVVLGGVDVFRAAVLNLWVLTFWGSNDPFRGVT